MINNVEKLILKWFVKSEEFTTIPRSGCPGIVSTIDLTWINSKNIYFYFPCE